MTFSKKSATCVWPLWIGRIMKWKAKLQLFHTRMYLSSGSGTITTWRSTLSIWSRGSSQRSGTRLIWSLNGEIQRKNWQSSWLKSLLTTNSKRKTISLTTRSWSLESSPSTTIFRVQTPWWSMVSPQVLSAVLRNSKSVIHDARALTNCSRTLQKL